MRCKMGPATDLISCLDELDLPTGDVEELETVMETVERWMQINGCGDDDDDDDGDADEEYIEEKKEIVALISDYLDDKM